MSKNGVCIICRENKDNLSDEHVIPDAIGGYYHIYTVCKECNSKLGQNIDSKLVNHYFTNFMRHDLELKGKTGKIPNPFEGTHVLDDDSDTKVKLNIGPDGKLNTYLFPKPTTRYDEDGKLHINIQLDSSDEVHYEKILNKILEREGINPKEHTINKLDTIRTTFQPVIKMEKTIEVTEFKIVLLKMAYEFAVDTIPSYFKDTSAIKISQILLNNNCNDINKYVMGNGFDKKIPESIEQMIDFEKKRHILILTNSHELGLICFISLYNLCTFLVKLSDNPHDGIMYIGINDLENKKFEKINAIEAIMRLYPLIDYKFQFFFRTVQESIEFQNLQLLNDFKYYSIDDKLAVFDTNLKIKYFHTELVDKYLELNLNQLDNYFEQKVYIRIPEILYLMILPANKYIQLTGIEVERKIVKI